MSDLTPVTRTENFLARIAGDDAPELEPITRTELFLAKIGGQDVETPEPITRTEHFLQNIIDRATPSGTINITENLTIGDAE